MLLRELYHLEEETKEKVAQEQRRLHSREIDEGEYEERYESIMTEYRLRTGIILKNM